jgi:hypothetical protein
MAAEPPQATHWNQYSARWQLVGAPLRPGPDDIHYLSESVGRLLERRPGDRALLLGVTPEIAELSWSPALPLLAVDKSLGMVKAVWPGDTSERRAVVGDWLSLELPEASLSLVMGDGVFSIFDFPEGYRALSAVLTRLLRPGGLASLRLFCRPEPAETVSAVFAALFERSIGNFHVFKWRLAMALQGDATRGVELATIWQTFHERVPSCAALAELTGWPEPVIANIDSYRGVADRYSFSTEREVVDVLSPGFELVERHTPSYELGQRCPHLTFRRRSP